MVQPATPGGRSIREVVFDFVEDALFRRCVIDRQDFKQRLEKLALLFVEFGRNRDFEVNDQIAPATALHMSHPSVAKTKLAAGLNTGWNLQLGRPLEGGLSRAE